MIDIFIYLLFWNFFKLSRFDDIKKFPVSHTCGFTLDLPDYKSYDILKNKLDYAIKNSFVISDGGSNFNFDL